MKLNKTLKALCAETGAQKAGIEKLLDYYVECCGWTEDNAVEYVYELFENGTIDLILVIGGKQPEKKVQEQSVDKDRLWHEGSLKVNGSIFRYWVKQYDEGSIYGIDEGRVSKLTIKRDGKEVCNYDRGWDIEPEDDNTKLALEILLHEYNK